MPARIFSLIYLPEGPWRVPLSALLRGEAVRLAEINPLGPRRVNKALQE